MRAIVGNVAGRSDTAVEAVAKALVAEHYGRHGWGKAAIDQLWQDVMQQHERDHYCAQARAAIEAYLAWVGEGVEGA